MPVLDSIRKRGLTDIIVVVTRYFGGTLLGTGGLVRAYGKCASEGITAAKPVICMGNYTG
jgi:putative IMPACT (imprinted ancient) family translation regulator